MSDHMIGSILIQKICTENRKLFTGAYSYEKNEVRLLDSCIEMRQLILSLIAIWFTERSMVSFLSGLYEWIEKHLFKLSKFPSDESHRSCRDFYSLSGSFSLFSLIKLFRMEWLHYEMRRHISQSWLLWKMDFWCTSAITLFLCSGTVAHINLINYTFYELFLQEKCINLYNWPPGHDSGWQSCQLFFRIQPCICGSSAGWEKRKKAKCAGCQMDENQNKI